MTIRARSTALTLFVFLLAGRFAHATGPIAISNLTSLTGSNEGEINLGWTAPHNGVGGPVAEYEIRYRAGGTITTEAEWGLGTFFSNSIAPANPGSDETLVVDGLQPGVSYGFAVKSKDASQVESPLSNSASAIAKDRCGQGSDDGEGTATVLPNTFKEGVDTDITVDFTAGAHDIQTGGFIEVRIPDAWDPPQEDINYAAGFVSYSPGGGVTALFDLEIENQLIRLTVNSGTLLSGENVQIVYKARTCDVGTHNKVRVFSQVTDCGSPVEITGSPFAMTVQNGDPQYVSFDAFELPVLINQITPLNLSVHDFCGRQVTTPGPITVTLSATHRDDNWNFEDDPLADLSLASNMSSSFKSGPVIIGAGLSSKTVYYQISSDSDLPRNYIQIDFQEFQPPNNNVTYLANVIPLTSGITNATVNTGIEGTLTHVDISADNDGTDDVAYIKATLPADMGWKILISPDNFSTITRTIYGFGQDVNAAWDGYTDWTPNSFPGIAPPDDYDVKITVQAGTIEDNTLSITLTGGGITGHVEDSSDNSALQDADVSVWGPTSRYTRTDSTGNFSIYGLKNGNYTLEFHKPGFSRKTITRTVSSNIVNTGTVQLQQLSILRLTVTRPATGLLDEKWGNVNAFTSNWSENNYATVHFAEGRTTAGAGDIWDGNETQTIDVGFSPSKNFTLRFFIPGLDVDDVAITALADGEVRTQTVNLTRRPIITGQLILPTTTTDGIWISVEGQHATTKKRIYGGAYIQPGGDAADYVITGASDGTYHLKTFAPGYVTSTLDAVVAGGSDSFGNDMTLSEGGSLTGQITVQGDTRGFGGTFNVYLSAQPIDGNGTGSYTSLSLGTDATQTQGNYTLKGFADGNYVVYAYMQGDFDVFPPGPKSVTVTGGSGALDITLKELDGALQGVLTLPNGYNDYANVKMDLVPFGGGFAAGGVTGTGGGGTPRTPSIDGSGNYAFSHLATGFYSLRAFHPVTGNLAETTVSIVNGQTTTRDIALNDQTYDISGIVTTEASSPFNSMDYYVNLTSPTTLGTIGGTLSSPAARILARRIENFDYYGGGDDFFIDPRKVFIGTVNTDGTYLIQNLPKGVYNVSNNGEMDNDFSNGRELAVTSQVVRIKDADVTDVNFTLEDGLTISGSMVIKSGTSEDQGRTLQLMLLNSRNKPVAQTYPFLSGTSVDFSLSHIPPNETYTLAIQDFGFPKKYFAKGTTIKLDNADAPNVQIDLLPIGTIQMQLLVKDSGELITQSNFNQILPQGFTVNARPNPFIPNGYATVFSPDENNFFKLGVGPGTYIVESRVFNFGGQQSLAKGQKSFVPVQISGIHVEEGQTVDLGTVSLFLGKSLEGTVTDKDGNPLPNVAVKAIPDGSKNHDDFVQTFTDYQGKYVLTGLDGRKKCTVIGSPYPDATDSRYGSDFDGTIYGEIRKTNVDLNTTTTLDFSLEPFEGSITGHVVAPDHKQLIQPFNNDSNAEDNLGAHIIMNKKGDIPLSNPLGDKERRTDADGFFTAKGLNGVYDIYFLAKGYGSVKKSNVEVRNGDAVDLGAITLVTGSKLSGKILNTKGEPASVPTDIDTIIAAADGLTELLIGDITADKNTGLISSYELSGFKPQKTYNILGLRDDKIIPFGSIQVSDSGTRDLQIPEDPPPTVIAVVSRGSDGRIEIRFESSDEFYKSEADADANGIADTDDPDELVQLTSGDGSLEPSNEEDDGAHWMSSDRKSLTFFYTPNSEGAFTMRVTAKFNAKKAATGDYQYTTNDFTFYTGVGDEETMNFPNLIGGQMELADRSGFSPQSGTFGDDDDQTDLVVAVTMRSAASAGSLPVGQNPLSSAVKMSDKLGLQAYPTTMARALKKIKALDISTFSSFYDIFLPAGVSHSFPEGKEAKICLAYDSSVSDPSNLNIYYYNSATDEYLLENENRAVDEDNRRICSSISHASVFTILSGSASIIAGGGYTGDLKIINFPNPFNLKSKTVTLQDPGSANATQVIDGTMIKLSIPPAMSGRAKIEIFDVAGELVRMIDVDVTGGTHQYVEWDGLNEHGKKVASGTYIARFTGGGYDRFFKMAVLK